MVLEFDVLIIGTGIAGLSTACKLAENHLSVGLITRANDPKISNTYYAQGGIIFPKKEDEDLEKDILVASSETSNKQAIELLKSRGGNALEEVLLKNAKTDFEHYDSGELKLTKEAAHSKARILYKGDFTGKEIEISLLNYLNDKKRFPNVSILTGHTAIDLLTPLHHGISTIQRYEDNKVVGVYALNQKSGEVKKIMAQTTVLATGGIGSLYLHHSNSEGARGDGHAMAARAGATLIDMEFIQFHPTTFYDQSTHRRFLISETLRGEGGKLINAKGEAFMYKYHKDADLAPRDVVARAILEEVIVTRHNCVYLDMTSKEEKWLKLRFPTIYEYCLTKNIDMATRPIPVVPAAHYTCGGVKTDLRGRATLPGLYAVGEVACTGLHGANRLASTSLLEGLTMGQVAAEDILTTFEEKTLYPQEKIKEWKSEDKEADTALINQDWRTLKQSMWNYVGLARSEHRLRRARAMFLEMREQIDHFYRNVRMRDDLIGLRNAVEVGQMVVKASMRNAKSVGCFFKKDEQRW